MSHADRLLNVLNNRYYARGWTPPLTLLVALAEVGIINPE